MAILNFPNDPKIGETYDENGVRYTWEGVQWTARNAGDYVEKSGDNMTGDLTLGTDKIVLDAGNGSGVFQGDLTCNDLKAAQSRLVDSNAFRVSNTTGNVYIGSDNTYVNAGIQLQAADGSGIFQGDIQSTSQNGGQLAGFRNQLINGNFYIWNRGASFIVPSNGIYSADRWYCNTSSGVTTTVNASAAGPVAAGFQYAIENTGSSYTACQQGVELLRKESNLQFAIGSQWTVSFWTTGDPTSTSVNVKWKTNIDDTGVLVSSTTPNFQSTGETANGFTRYAATITITVDASTVSDSNCIAVILPLFAREKLAGAQFEPGPVATPFEHRPIGTELALCQRYYQKLDALYMPIVNNNDNPGGSCARSVVMRADPTETGTFGSSINGGLLTGSANIWRCSGSSVVTNSTQNVSNLTADAEL